MNNIEKLISEIEAKGFLFRASRAWYRSVGTNPKEFAKFRKNQKQPTFIQLQNIATAFKVSVDELITKTENQSSTLNPQPYDQESN
ncbi:hypothetical protein [Algivirga pacifica]|uniref:HTH cro/C1-type domain-containing protein n=1 Tax=Algivirga pacifica TaxID=1162670 RepID=A0ABP9D543_9BACT